MMKRFIIMKTLLFMMVLLIGSISIQAQSLYEPEQIVKIDWSTDGQLLAVATGGQGLNLVDTSTYQVTRTIPVDLTGMIFGAAFSPDATKIVVGGSNLAADTPLSQLWDVQTGKPAIPPQKRFAISTSIVWNEDGSLFVAGGLGNQYVIDATTGEEILMIPGAEDTAQLTWNDNDILAISWAAKLELWDMTTLQMKQRIMTSSGLRFSMQWSADNQHLLAANTTRSPEGKFYSIQILDSTTGEIVRKFDGFPTYLTSVHWSPNETQILSTSTDGMVRITEVASGTTNVILTSDQPILSAAWSPYGGRIAVGVALKATAVLEGKTAAIVNNSVAGLSIIVPDASLAQMKSIAAGCLVEPISNLDTLTMTDLPEFLTQIETLPPDAIPPACAADLIAVAEAIIAQ